MVTYSQEHHQGRTWSGGEQTGFMAIIMADHQLRATITPDIPEFNNPDLTYYTRTISFGATFRHKTSTSAPSVGRGCSWLANLCVCMCVCVAGAE